MLVPSTSVMDLHFRHIAGGGGKQEWGCSEGDRRLFVLFGNSCGGGDALAELFANEGAESYFRGDTNNKDYYK